LAELKDIMTIRTRFAPSPTGYLHIGGIRTALFCWLYAKKHGGEFLLRIEDTDRERSTQESVDAILDGMAWTGLDYDGEAVLQSDRFDRYHEVADQLLSSGQAYQCYCSKDELDEMRAAQTARGENPRYDGRCRNRADAEDGIKPVLRFKTPTEGSVTVNDLIHGDVTFENTQLDDLVIIRSDGWPTYHFSVVIDDHDMDITHVFRGDDHLNNTPRQIHMIEALGYARPVYAHMPMILGADGARLSKRHGAVNVMGYKDEGYLPDALINYLVRLGWSHGDDEIFTREQMVSYFDIVDVNPAASKFNGEKLDWVNQQYIIAGTGAEHGAELAAQLELLGVDINNGPVPADVYETFKERAVTLNAMAASMLWLYQDFDSFDEKAAKKNLRPVIKEPLIALHQTLAGLTEWTAENIHNAIQAVADQFALKFGKLGQPVRVIVTGAGVSPPIDTTVELVGKERTLQRFDLALEYIAMREAAAG
jgi:glutamyl-tRNA synthetase